MKKLFDNKELYDPVENFNISENRQNIPENVVIHIRKNPIKSNVITLAECKDISKLKLINPYTDEEIFFDNEVIVYINEKPFIKSKDMLIMEFPEAKISNMYSNKSMLYIQHKFNGRFYVDQFISTRSIELYFNYKLDNMHISFVVWKIKAQELKQTIKNNNTKTFSINTKFVLDLTNIDGNIDNETKDLFIGYPYINFKQICECTKYREMFEVFENIYTKTKDLNYVKSIDYLSKLAYQKMGGKE